MRPLKIRYFASAAEAAGTDEELWPGTATLAELRGALTEKYGGPMARVLSAGSFLVNGTVRRDDGPLSADISTPSTAHGDTLTVDVLPPFAGG